MNKVYVIYTTDGYNDQVVDKVFTSYNLAMLYVVKCANHFLSGVALQKFADEDRTIQHFKGYIHEFEVDI